MSWDTWECKKEPKDLAKGRLRFEVSGVRLRKGLGFGNKSS